MCESPVPVNPVGGFMTAATGRNVSILAIAIATLLSLELGHGQSVGHRSAELSLPNSRHSSGWSAAAAHKDGRFLVAWSDALTGRVMTQVITGIADGQVTAPQLVSASAAVDSPALAVGLTDPPVVVWVTAQSINMRVLNDDWTVNPARPEIPLLQSTASFGFHSPKIAKMSHARDPYLVTWIYEGTVYGRIVRVQSSGEVSMDPLIRIS